MRGQEVSNDSAGRSAGWMRVLHFFYLHGNGVNFFFSRRLRPPGVAVSLLIVLGSVLTIGRPVTAVFFLFAMALAVVVLGLMWTFLRRCSVSAERILPRYGTVDQPVGFSVRLTNRGPWRRLRQVGLIETLGDTRPSWGEFSTLREPGEEERNGFDRTLAYYRWRWLMRQRRLFEGGHTEAAVDVPRDQAVMVRVELTPLRRGVIQLTDLRLLLPDPMGLFQRCVRISSAPATLTILPKRYQLPPIELPGSASYRVGSVSSSNWIGNDGEFVSLRDYRAGDPLRQIHWRSWARAGRPITKELENTHFPRHGLVLDTGARSEWDPVFEEMVSIAASLVSGLDTNEGLLDLMFVKNHAHRVTAGRGVGRVDSLLEVLAGVTPELEPDLDALSRLVMRHRDDLDACLVILRGWDESRQTMLRQWLSQGMICVLLVVGEGEAPSGVPGYWIDTRQTATSLLALQGHLTALSS